MLSLFFCYWSVGPFHHCGKLQVLWRIIDNQSRFSRFWKQFPHYHAKFRNMGVRFPCLLIENLLQLDLLNVLQRQAPQYRFDIPVVFCMYISRLFRWSLMAFCIPQSILGTIYPPWFYHWSLFLRASELPLIQPFFGVLPSLFSHTRCTVSLPRRRSFWHNCTFSQDVTPICFSPSPPFKKYKGRVWIEKPVIVRNFPVPFLVFHLHFLLFCCKIKGQYDLSKFTALSAVLGAPTPGAVFIYSRLFMA